MSTENKALFNGNNATIWVNGIPFLFCTKGSIKKKIDYEEIPAPIGGGKKRIEVGHTIEVSLTYKPTGVEDLSTLMSDDVEIIMADINIGGTYLKKAKASGVTFDEQPIIDFEKNKVSEIELTGQAETYKSLI
jgi:hypothetical protein